MKTPELSAREIAARVRRGDLAAEDSVRAALSRIAERSALNAVVHRMDEAALSSAREIDRRRAAGAELGPLAGVPVAVKDNIATKDAPTTCASRILAGCRLPYDATAVARRRAADAVIVGKTNCDEFGMGSSNENSCHGAVRHPLDPDRTPGDSSGGSAVVVVDRQVPLARTTSCSRPASCSRRSSTVPARMPPATAPSAR